MLDVRGDHLWHGDGRRAENVPRRTTVDRLALLRGNCHPWHDHVAIGAPRSARSTRSGIPLVLLDDFERYARAAAERIGNCCGPSSWSLSSGWSAEWCCKPSTHSAKSQLGLNEFRTSMLAASIGVGTAVGCILGGYLSHDRVNRSVVVGGAVWHGSHARSAWPARRPAPAFARLLRQHPGPDSARRLQRDVHRTGASGLAIAPAAKKKAE